MKKFSLLIIISTLLACSVFSKKQDTETARVYTQTDSVLVVQKINQYKAMANMPTSSVFSMLALSFIDTPYKSYTLENQENEQLVINLREFDCTTFIETCLALSLTIKSESPSFDKFCKTLESIRYRNGKLTDYTGRLHYFTDWISDNSQKAYISDITRQLGGIPYPNMVNFMSTHTGAYKQLQNNAEFVSVIQIIEETISKRKYFYIPKDDIRNTNLSMTHGSIVAFTTAIDGLDVVHTGIVINEKQQIKLLHASSDKGKVILSETKLEEYIQGNKLQTGIMILSLNK